MKEFKLSKTGALATVEVLGPQHLQQVLTLQDETRAALPEAQKMFVLPQANSYFEDLLNRKTGLMLGVHTGGKLISQMAVMGPQTLKEVIDSKMLTRNLVSFHHAALVDSVVIAKSMAVHPEWRGNELSQHMLETALEQPFVCGADHMFAQVSVDNVRSWDVFLRCGFGIVAAGIDPLDDRPRFIMQKPTLDFVYNKRGSIVDDVDSAADFAAIMRLTEREALIGRLDDGVAFKLAFFANADLAATWQNLPAQVKKNH